MNIVGDKLQTWSSLEMLLMESQLKIGGIIKTIKSHFQEEIRVCFFLLLFGFKLYLFNFFIIKAFIAINNDNFGMDVTLQTGLPSGTYCDVNSGNKVNGACTGRTVNVNGDGTARINIPYYQEDPVIAIHIESKL